MHNALWLWLCLGLGLTLALPIAVIIRLYRHIIMHYKYDHNALWMDGLSNVLLKKLTVYCLSHFKSSVHEINSRDSTKWTV